MGYAFAIFIFLFSLSKAQGQILFTEISDSHSNYDKMLEFLNDFSFRVEQFKLMHPQGQVVLLVNGDYSGASGLASAVIDGRADEGMIGIRMLVDLSKAGVKVIYNSGNHDGHDFAKRHRDNHVFRKEMTVLSNTGRDVVLLGTNIDFTNSSGLGHLFSRHHDLKDPLSGVTRIFGLTLETLYSKSSVVTEKDTLFARIQSYESALREQLLRTVNEDPVDRVIIMIHDSTPAVEQVAKRIEAEFKGRVSFAGWIAGHDHIQKSSVTAAGTLLINAGSQFENVVAYLGSEGQLKDLQISTSKDLGQVRSESLKTSLALRIRQVAKQAESKIKDLKSAMERNIYGFSENLIHGKIDMKKSPRLPLGIALGNTFRNWAQSSVDELTDGRAVIGFFNTSSYRIDNGYNRKVAITDLLLSEVYPFEGSAKLLELTGRQFLEIVRKIVWYQESLTAVQFSDNVRVLFRNEIKTKENGHTVTIAVPEIIELKTASGGWRTLGDKEPIIVGVDSWTGDNGYKIDFSKNIYGQAIDELRFINKLFSEDFHSHLKPQSESGTLAVFQKYLAKELVAMPREIDSKLVPRSAAAFYCHRFYQVK